MIMTMIDESCVRVLKSSLEFIQCHIVCNTDGSIPPIWFKHDMATASYLEMVGQFSKPPGRMVNCFQMKEDKWLNGQVNFDERVKTS